MLWKRLNAETYHHGNASKKRGQKPKLMWSYHKKKYLRESVDVQFCKESKTVVLFFLALSYRIVKVW